MKRATALGFLVLFFVSPLSAKDYFVATDGSDSNNGSESSPFATIQKAADEVEAGDTCYIRGGSYHQDTFASGLTGSSSEPITFVAYPGETVTIDGTIPIAGPWVHHSGNIYKTTLGEDIWQLFVDGQMMNMARWPNLPPDADPWNQDQEAVWAHGNEALSLVNVVEVDDVYSGESLAGSWLDMTGAMAILNIGSFKTWPRLVTSHTAGSSNFTYNDIPALGYRDKHHYYYMECKLNLLDIEKEWYYDKDTGTLYFYAPGGGVPSGDIRGKTQTYALNFYNCDYLVIDGFDFFGTTFSIDDSNYCIVRNCNLQYPSYSKRMLGSEADIEYTRAYAPFSSSPGNTVLNCIFEKTDGMALEVNGAGSVVENNYFHNIDTTCAGLPGLGVALRVAGGYDTVFRRNTIDVSSTSSTISPSYRAITEYNRITRTGMLQSDGSCIHRMVAEAPSSISRYNWIHDSVKYSIRFDGDPGGVQGLVHHNAVWNVNCMRLKGDEHQIYNNIGFDYTDSRGNINVALDKGGNPNSITRNNAAALITDYPIPGIDSNNYDASRNVPKMRDVLRDPDNLDFRPKAGSLLIDAGMDVNYITDDYIGAAPDIGAYEHGDSNYWIAGRKWPQASTPIPPDGAVNVKLDADLMWLEGYEADSHDIYLGDSPEALVFKGNQTNNILDPVPAGNLYGNATYYWRVDVVKGAEVVEGDVWSFTVEDGPVAAPINLSPENGVESLAVPVTFTWQAGANADRHDLYISTDENLVINLDPSVCVSDVTSPHVTVGLDLEAEYFWRIAAVTGEEVTAGDIWSFTTEGWSAMIPVNTSPENGAESLAAPVTLTWQTGANADRHDLYISTDENLVINLDPGVCVSDAASPHVAAGLALGMEYFWCVNAISSEAPQGISSEVWSFTALNYEVIEDFEGAVWTASGGADVTAESNIVYEGSQSMRIDYDDSGGNVSEAVLMFGTPLDLSAYTGGKALSVMFHGVEGNSPEVMYFKLYDSSMSATVVYPEQADIVQYIWSAWLQWNIDLGDFGGIDLSDVAGFAIGFGDGSEDGNLGTVYVDDIRVYASRCVPELAGGDIVDDDCVAGLNDLKILAGKWLDADKTVYAEAVSEDGLVLWFEFEEAFGTSVADSANGYTALVNGTPVLGVAGKVGRCIDFNSNGYLSLLSPAAAFGTVSDELTITMWIYGDDLQPGTDGELAYSTLFRGDAAGILSFLYAQGPSSNGAPIFGAKNMSGEHFFAAWADAAPDDWKNRWNHYAFVRNTNDSSLGIYCNGMLVAEKVSGEIGLIPGESMSLFWIGYFPKYHGKIDEFRVYDRALSQGEILALAEKISVVQPVVSVADMDGDGTVNLADFASVAQNWLTLSLWPAY